MRRSSVSWRGALLVVAALAAAGCADDPVAPDIEDIDFASSLDIDIATFTEKPSGVFYKDITVGQGTLAEARDEVTVNIVGGWLTDGTQFEDGGNLTFVAGITLSECQAQARLPCVIAGFQDGVIGMLEGGERVFIIPPQLGFGSQDTGPIPANSVIVFRVRLLDVVT